MSDLSIFFFFNRKLSLLKFFFPRRNDFSKLSLENFDRLSTPDDDVFLTFTELPDDVDDMPAKLPVFFGFCMPTGSNIALALVVGKRDVKMCDEQHGLFRSVSSSLVVCFVRSLSIDDSTA